MWWLLPYDDPTTGKHFDFEWQSTINDRTSHSRGCPYLSRYCSLVWVGFNDLATIEPQLALEWHPTKNGELKPTDVTVGSQKKAWWLLPYDDPKTGKHFEFEWKASVVKRATYGKGCPYLVGKSVYIGFNDLASTHPQLIKEWHPIKNGSLKPTDVTAGSQKKVWWMINFTNPKTGEKNYFEWISKISHRVDGANCPLLNSSQMERLTYNLLNQIGVHFKAEKKFLKCKEQKQLPFDIYLTQQNKIIELDGIQHFQPINAWGGKENLLLIRKHDEIKDNFCKENNILLLRIPYIYDANNDKIEIEIIIKNFVKYGIIPDKIIDFYESENRITYINLITKMLNL